MSPLPHPPVDPEIPGLLRLLLQRFRAGERAGVQALLDKVGALRLAAAETLVGALCLGGADFAAWLVGRGRDTLPSAERYAIVLQAFETLVQAPPDAAAGHETRLAQGLVAGFGLQASAATLLDTLRAEFLIAAGPLEELPRAAVAAFELSQWELALRGFIRYQQALQAATPREVYGMASMCLHRLGQYGEAERWAQHGLGERQRALLAIGPVPTEAELLQRWGGSGTPVVSILCTSYNHERYIESAIRGFLSQDCSFPFEILIHDDASTDGTQRIIRDWQKRYPKLIHGVLQVENQFSRGVRPFELLLARARGEFVATCEGDDFWVDASKLQRQVGFLQSHPEFSCSAHNYYHYVESTLSVKAWFARRRELVLSERELMGLRRLLWWPTLVFRKTFSTLPPERALSPIGDQFVTSYLGTFGPCMYFENLLGAVRRENEYSLWSPLSSARKEEIRVQTWQALVRMHENMGNEQAVADLKAKIAESLQGLQRDAASSEVCPEPRPTASEAT